MHVTPLKLENEGKPGVVVHPQAISTECLDVADLTRRFLGVRAELTAPDLPEN
jgi:hypothetical protein